MYGELKGVKILCLTHFNGHIDQDYVAAYCTEGRKKKGWTVFVFQTEQSMAYMVN